LSSIYEMSESRQRKERSLNPTPNCPSWGLSVGLSICRYLAHELDPSTFLSKLVEVAQAVRDGRVTVKPV
jgi:hypothetical protein